jgi:hypothetical protein
MLMALNPDERELFQQLISASTVMATVSRNAATVLSEEFEDMITGPLGVLEMVLQQCPQVGRVAWDGQFRIEDCLIEYYTPDVPEGLRPFRLNTGVRATHKPTGTSAEMHQSDDVEVNKARVIRYLRTRVEHLQPT